VTDGEQGGRLGRAAAVGLLAVADLAVALLCLGVVTDSTHLEARFVAGDETCPWRLDPSAGGVTGLEGPAEDHCVRSIAGVELGPASLIEEPGYLESREALAAFYEGQAALRHALAGRGSTEVVVVGADGREHGARVLAREGLEPTEFLYAAAGSFTCLAFLAIGLFVFWRRPWQEPAMALLAITQGGFICAAVTVAHAVRGLGAEDWMVRSLLPLNSVGFLMGPVGMLYLAAVFPEPRLGRLRRPLALYLPLGLVTAVFTAELRGAVGLGSKVGAVVTFAALVLLVVAHMRARGQAARLAGRWIIWGFLPPVLLWTALRIPLALGIRQLADPTDALVVLSMGTIPAGMAVAVLRHGLLDIAVVFRRTLLGAGVAAATVLAYSLGVAAISGEVTSGGGAQAPFGTVLVTAMILAFVLLPTFFSLDRSWDRLFRRKRYAYHQVLSEVANELVAARTPEASAGLVISAIVDSMEAEHAIVALAPGAGAPRSWARSRGEREASEASASTPSGTSLWGRVGEMERPGVLDLEVGAGSLHDWMEEHGLEVVIPLRAEGELTGMLACAAPMGGKLLSPKDLAALRNAGAALALALSRTIAEEEKRALYQKLEERIAERTCALEKARLETFQWEKMAALGLLASGVAHELNTPLGVTVSTADQLQRRLEDMDEGGSKMTRLAQLCSEAAGRAASIVTDLRAFSRTESEGLGMVDLQDVVDATLRLLDPMLRSRGVSVQVHHGDVPLVEGYSPLLNQTVMNLVINAATAIDHDGEIHIRTTASDGVVSLVVEDDGPGISAEARAHIFEPFYTTKNPGEGTGLGLALCYTFVEQHGGKIWEEGEEGKGARFVIELPIKSPANGRAPARAD